jgi:hypothetical protein
LLERENKFLTPKKEYAIFCPFNNKVQVKQMEIAKRAKRSQARSQARSSSSLSPAVMINKEEEENKNSKLVLLEKSVCLAELYMSSKSKLTICIILISSQEIEKKKSWCTCDVSGASSYICADVRNKLLLKFISSLLQLFANLSML